MNKSYRLIYNEITQTWVAAAETVKGRGKRASGAVVLAAAAVLMPLLQPQPGRHHPTRPSHPHPRSCPPAAKW